MIDSTAPLCETYKMAIASAPFVKHPPNGWITGCLYDESGRVIRLSQRFGGYYGDFYPSSDSASIATADFSELPILGGRSIYLGNYMAHYGHFLVEMLSTFWLYKKFPSFDKFVFHPFVFGEGLPSYIKDAFEAFGIPLEKIYIIKSKMVIEDVTIPERLVKLNKSAKAQAKQVYRYLADIYSAKNSRPRPRRCYMSRVRMSLKSGKRAILNEPFFESFLNRMGFITVYPELLSFQEQVSLFHQADIVCGLSGSALHNCVFMRPNSLLIEIADPRSFDTAHPMQIICNRLSNVTYHFIPFSGRILHRKNQLGILNLSRLASQITFILEQASLESQVAPVSTPRGNSISLKICYINTLMILINILRFFKWRLKDMLPKL